VSYFISHKRGGSVVIVAIYSPINILLIKETTKKKPYQWKLISERTQEGETVLDTFVRGCKEEGGFDLMVLSENGHVVKIDDPRVQKVIQLCTPEAVPTDPPHMRHVWGILTTPQVVASLANKVLTPTPEERIETAEFPHVVPPDFLPSHQRFLPHIAKTLHSA
jgi:ADP-ribose pyrophosphatase YjhB (NUDIX family)